jgi:hypothetical protein
MERLAGELSNGCQYLYVPLIDSAEGPQVEQAGQAILAGLNHESPLIGWGAAKALHHLPESLLESNAQLLRERLEFWRAGDSWCPRCEAPVTGSACPECRTVTSSPCADILKALARVREQIISDLIDWSDDGRSDFQGRAVSILMGLVSGEESQMHGLLNAVNQGEAKPKILDAILALPTEVLQLSSEHLKQLVSSDHEWVRTRIIRSLPSGWIAKEDGMTIARDALEDRNEGVRNEAVKAMRALG